MREPKLSVIVPTYDRSSLLRVTLDSILAQDFNDFRVIVLDNASTDDTPALAREYMLRDSRVSYVRNPQNVGLVRNWNRAFAINRSEYLSVFHDDDVMLPGFLTAVVGALDEHPTAGFAVVEVQWIDQAGTVTGTHHFTGIPTGRMSGLDLLELAVRGQCPGMSPPAVVVRASATEGLGPLDSPHTRCQVDTNFYYRIAAKHDVVLIPRVLAQYREHGRSATSAMRGESAITVWYGENSEHIDAATLLLESDRAADPSYRAWLAERIRDLHLRKSAAIHMALPSVYHDWQTRTELLKQDILELTAVNETVILVDDCQLGLPADWEGRTLLPFLERDGAYWGAPTDDEQALANLDRLIARGARWLVFAWPSLWWTDHYRRFHQHLNERFACRSGNANARIFELGEFGSSTPRCIEVSDLVLRE
jgi:glycosyltransferase involved in cell wall biosynthesis